MPLDSEVKDAWDLLKECGGTMARENNPMADKLVEMGFAKEGPTDKFGRRTIQDATAQSAPLDPKYDVDKKLDGIDLTVDIDKLRQRIRDLKLGQMTRRDPHIEFRPNYTPPPEWKKWRKLAKPLPFFPERRSHALEQGMHYHQVMEKVFLATQGLPSTWDEMLASFRPGMLVAVAPDYGDAGKPLYRSDFAHLDYEICTQAESLKTVAYASERSADYSSYRMNAIKDNHLALVLVPENQTVPGKGSMPWGLRCPAKLQHAADMILTLGRTQYNGPLTMRILKHRARPTGGGYPEFVIPRRCINCTGLGYVLNASGKGSRPCSQCEGTGVVQ